MSIKRNLIGLTSCICVILLTVIHRHDLFDQFLEQKTTSLNNEVYARKLQITTVDESHHHHKSAGCHPLKFIPPFKTRVELGEILKNENKTFGAELGVQTGKFTDDLLSKWQIAHTYLLVDVWAKQENYKDGANVDNNYQNQFFADTMKVVDSLKSKGFLKEAIVCRNFTSSCVLNYPDHYFDFIYVDARHDYKVKFRVCKQLYFLCGGE